MRSFILITLLLGSFCGCKHTRITIDRNYKFSFDDEDEAALYSPMEKWFAGSNGSSNFCIRAFLAEGFICCYVINVSEQDLIVHRGSYDFLYALKYRDLNGASAYSTPPYSYDYTLASSEVLSPNPHNGISISPYASLPYKIPIPKDCARILSIAVAIEYATFSEIKQCRGVNDLHKLFKKNTVYVPVDFFDDVAKCPVLR